MTEDQIKDQVSQLREFLIKWAPEHWDEKLKEWMDSKHFNFEDKAKINKLIFNVGV